jgi:hypothetical protein
MLVSFIPFQNDLQTEDIFYMNYSSTLGGQLQGLGNALGKVASMYRASGNQTLVLLDSRYKLLDSAVIILRGELGKANLAGSKVKYTQAMVLDGILGCIGSTIVFVLALMTLVACVTVVGCFLSMAAVIAAFLTMENDCLPSSNQTTIALDTVEVLTETPNNHRIASVNVTLTNSTWSTSELSNKHGESTFQNVLPGYYSVTAENFTASNIYLAPAPIPATVTVILKRLS